MRLVTRILSAYLICAAGQASAGAIIERDVLVEFADGVPSGSRLETTADIAPGVVLDIGDTLILNFEFVGGLRYEDSGDPDFEYLGFNLLTDGTGENTGYLFDVNFLFTDFSGDLLRNDVTSGFGGPPGGFLFDVDFAGDRLDVFGLTTTTTISSKEPGRGTFNSSQVNLTAIYFDQRDKVSTGVVPLPSTLALLAIGVVGLQRRRIRLVA